MLAPNEQFRIFQATRALGEKAIAAEFSLYPNVPNFEQMYLSFKAFTLPISAPQEMIEYFSVGGQRGGTPQTPETYFQGSVQLYEDVNGNIKVRKNEADKSAKVDGIIALIIAMHCSLDNPTMTGFGFRTF